MCDYGCWWQEVISLDGMSIRSLAICKDKREEYLSSS